MKSAILAIILLSALGSACGRPPCPAEPTVSADCTDTFRYGDSCFSQPEYSAKGDQDNVNLYDRDCKRLLQIIR